jgi:L-alanine-DL-glutamate epimerase-like enolase superfamily enzyme
MSDYDVVLLIEQPFTAQDATNLRRLHEDIEDPVRYHVMLPVEDASSRVETAMGTLGTGEVLTTPPVTMGEADLEGLQRELLDTCRGRDHHRDHRAGGRPGRR